MARRFVLFLASAVAVQTQGNSQRAQWCTDNFANPGAACTSPAARGMGPCYQCGPLKTVATQQLCAGVCIDTATDPNICGSCGHVVNTANDDANCGRCGHVCASTEFCLTGVCKPKLVPCNNPFVCGGEPTFCGSGGPGSLCVCFNTLHGQYIPKKHAWSGQRLFDNYHDSNDGNPAASAEGTACLDINKLGGCPPTQCSSSESCGPGEVCIPSCCGKSCVAVGNACPGAAPLSRLLRRESIADLAALSPWLNSTMPRIL